MASLNEKKVTAWLLAQSQPVAAEEISKACSVSLRSVYGYLAHLKQNPEYELQTFSKNYQLFKRTAVSSEEIPANYEERKQYIFRQGLIRQKELSVSQLQDFFAVSESTMHADIIRLRREIARFHVKLSIKGDSMYFLGAYHDLKRLTRGVIYAECSGDNSILSSDRLQNLFPGLDVRYVKMIIQEQLDQSCSFMDEYSLINLLIHILVTVNQELHGMLPVEDDRSGYVSPAVHSICTAIENQYNFRFSHSSMHQFSMIMDTRMMKEESNSEIRKDPRTEMLSVLIFNELKEAFDLSFDEPEIRYSFVFHLDNLLVRLKNKIALINPMLDIIKRESPVTYDVSVFIADILQEQTGYSISESEIAYIALHIGVRVEEIKNARNKLKTVVICPEYYLGRSNIPKISKVFGEDLYITKVYTSYEQCPSFTDNDLYLTTAPILDSTDSRGLVQITPFLNDGDRSKISRAVEEVRRQKKLSRSRENVSRLFDEDLFFPHQKFEDKDQVLKNLSDVLRNKGYVTDHYYPALLKREQIAPTDFGLIAIPHPSECRAVQTKIAAAVLEHPINWGRSNVSVVFMIAISRTDFHMLEEVFSSLLSVAGDSRKLKMLIKCETHQSFLNQLLELMEA